ncbi:type I DNA topoisomerase [Chromatium okenii]|uniref:type I DNA topoisomerase n=1 Tax=Chromatium okenii TaxID=61644 RepID=UPI001F5BCB28|nr:type I DNA topoisomerase [Chromatium okenii]
MNLVIVESPAKAKTIKKYLGADFEVIASYGHVRDLVPKEGAVDPDNGFAMKYQIIERNEKHVQAIAKKLKDASALYLATDPDREGEAISWHLYELLKGRRQLGERPVHRIVFNEITKRAVQEAVANPRELSYDLVNAQQARRALDYLVGFNLSPLLWKKIRRGLSAGRVQSPALRLICERENEIEAFVQQEYWTLEADAAKDTKTFSAKLTHFDGVKLEQFSIIDADRASFVRQQLEQAAAGTLRVEQVERKQRKRQPAPPFITSTLQQEAARKLGFTALRTMRVAQQLYEGVDVDGEAVGLITYMRTDSVNWRRRRLRKFAPMSLIVMAQPICRNSRAYSKPNPKTRRKRMKPFVPRRFCANRMQSKRIWLRTIPVVRTDLETTLACQMAHALINQVAVDLSAGTTEHLLRANGAVIAEPGFMRVYLEGRDDVQSADDDEERMLPEMQIGEQIKLLALRTEQHFTEAPPRYSEASLVKALEEFGIGRPSTYASIISTLQDREYVTLDKKRFSPTDVGRVVNRFLTEHFTAYVDYDFTAKLEDELDAVSRGEEEWVPLLEHFWKPFKDLVDHTQAHVKRSDVTQEKLDELCPNAAIRCQFGWGATGGLLVAPIIPNVITPAI